MKVFMKDDAIEHHDYTINRTCDLWISSKENVLRVKNKLINPKVSKIEKEYIEFYKSLDKETKDKVIWLIENYEV